jgi:quinol monooxygenase YgiN
MREKLNTFNGKREQRMKVKRNLTAYLNQIRNDNGVPLYYVIRDPELEDQYRNNNVHGAFVFSRFTQVITYLATMEHGRPVVQQIPSLIIITMSKKRGHSSSVIMKAMM